MEATYQLSSFTGLTSKWKLPRLFRDGEQVLSNFRDVTKIEAEVLSGDYFITVATQLDSISRRVEDYATRIYLENIVSDLIYLQDSYTIVKDQLSE